jgi:hypothetical protein
MKLKSELVGSLRKDELFNNAIKHAKDDAARVQITKVVEQFVSGFAELLEPLAEAIKTDPTLADKLGRALTGDVSLLNDNEQIVSGSNG